MSTPTAYDIWLDPTTREDAPVTCAGTADYGIYLNLDPDRVREFKLTDTDLQRVLADVDGLEIALNRLLYTKGVTLDPYCTSDCPKKGEVFTEDDYAPGTDRCGVCGSETRVMDEELRP